jgi:Holliday junction resolvase RusA-like endonuclease
MLNSKIIEFTCQFPKIGVGKYKNQLCTLNNIPKFYRYEKTKIKNKFKEQLLGWTVPRVDYNYPEGYVEFQLYRPTKLRLDADAGALVYKWIVDLLVEEGYFKDDDQITFILKPVIVDKERVETEIKVTVYANDDR